jgi:hypothetical protein
VWAAAILLHVPLVLFLANTLWWHGSEGWLHPATEFREPTPQSSITPFSLAAPRTATHQRSPVSNPVLQRLAQVHTEVIPQVHEPVSVPAGEQRGLPVPNLPQPAVTPGAITIPTAPATGTIQPALIAPGYGTGVLWGQTTPAPTAEQLAQRVLGLGTGARMDSLVVARLQQYVDSMAEEYASQRPASWTTGFGNKKVGVDSKWIYLGPIKIPTMILALLPINIQSNPTETEFNKRLSLMREDLLEAARRSRNYADFKNAVHELRVEKQAEKDFQDNQRTPPKSGGGLP